MRGRARVLECVHSLLKLEAQVGAVRAGGLKWRMTNGWFGVWYMLKIERYLELPPVEVRCL